MAVAQKTSSDKRKPSSSGVDHGQRRQLAVEQILADIFGGKLAAGERLVIQKLAQRFGFSQSPVREALVTLEGIGIVDIEPNRGAVVRRVTATDVKEICQVRRALECTAVRSACGRIRIAELQELAKAFRAGAENVDQKGQQPQASPAQGTNKALLAQGTKKAPPDRGTKKAIRKARELDTRLHDLIAESCGNHFLQNELGRMNLLFRSFRDVAWDQRALDDDLPRFAEECREHLKIVEALLAADARAASKAMSHHIRSGMRYWSRGLPK